MATAGPNSPSTAVDDAGIGAVAWTSPGNVTASDNTRATVSIADTTVTHYIKTTAFGFAIPTGATIDGILVEIERHRVGSVNDNRISLVRAGTIETTNKSAGAAWPAADAYASFGGAADLWSAAWTLSDINDTGFGVAVSAVGGAGGDHTALVDHMRITVYYTAAASTAIRDIIGGGIIPFKR